MNFIAEYEAEIAEKAAREIAAEDAAWKALGPEGQRQALAELGRKRKAEGLRQERIAKDHDAMFGPDDDDETEEE